MRKNPSRNRYALLLILLVLLQVSGCKKKEPVSSPVVTPRPIQAKTQAVQTQITSSKPIGHEQQFDFTGKRDPFKPFIVEIKQPEGAPKKAGGLPIQNFEVSQFRVTGIIVGLKENIAQVLDPTGKAYTLKKGMVIGSNNGRVTAINATHIEVKEKFHDESGRLKSRTVRLPIPKKN